MVSGGYEDDEDLGDVIIYTGHGGNDSTTGKQVADQELETPAGGYAEGAHIRPLGRPHEGPDTADNVLCLCPNHHLLFDTGALVVTDIFEVLNNLNGTSLGMLRLKTSHEVRVEHLQYHRARFGG